SAREAEEGIADDLELVPIDDAPLAPAVAAAPPSRKRQVLKVNGGVLVSQDGVTVTYRKKCRRCSYTDIDLTTLPIQPGITRVTFECSKGGEQQQIEVRAEH